MSRHNSIWSLLVRVTQLTLFSTVLATVSALPLSTSEPLEKKDVLLTNYVDYANHAITQLMTMYDNETGLWSGDWWNSANVITMLADYQDYYPAEVQAITAHVFPNTLAKAPGALGYTGFLDGFYDDELWWALAWIKVYDVTGEQKYLDTASSIFEDAKSVWGSTPCGGLW